MTQIDKPSATTLDDVVSGLRMRPGGLVILALCVLIAMSEGYDVQAMALAAPLVKTAWSLNAGQIGALLTASVLGLVLGSVFLAPAGDRVGRRPATLAGLALASAATFAGAFAPDLGLLLGVRLLAGLGLGLALPNLIAIAMETAPVRWRTLAIVAVGCGYPVGAGFGGAMAGAFAPTHGYAIVFLIGGAATAVAFALAALGLPESPYFLVRFPARAAKLRRLLGRLGLSVPETTLLTASTVARPRLALAALFTPDRRATTLLLWLLNFANFAMLYFFVSWLPSLLSYRGLSAGAALTGLSAFNASGVIGGLTMALLLSRVGPTRVLGAAYILAAIGVGILGLAPTSNGTLYLAIALAGAGIVGSQFCLTAVVNHFYPPETRVGAAGYAQGVGRLGAITAPLAGAALLIHIPSLDQVFLVTAVPSLVALAAVIVLDRSRAIARAA